MIVECIAGFLVGVWLQYTFGFPWGPLRNGWRHSK